MGTKNKLKPFVKWAGGKTQLIPEIVDRLPDMSMIDTYVEPFVGGGAMLFYVLENYPQVKCVINDINKDLINAYQVIKFNPKQFLFKLKELEDTYNFNQYDEERAAFYYNMRDTYNDEELRGVDREQQAAMFIALNKLGFK